MPTTDQIKAQLKTWIKTATGLTNQEVLFFPVKGPKPTGLFFTINPNFLVEPVGMHDQDTPRPDGKIAIDQTRERTVSINAYNDGAFEALRSALDALQKESIRRIFSYYGISIHDYGKARGWSIIEGDSESERAQADIIIGYSNIVVDDVGYFTKVEITDRLSIPNQTSIISPP
jgi:hypothetical protein